MIENGKEVKLEYSVVTDDNQTVDSNVGKDPLIFKVGANQILPALEEALFGLDSGDTKQITLTPEKAYGQVNPEAFQEVKKEMIPEEYRQVNALLIAQDPQVGEVMVRVHEVKDENVVLDFNHPLAGKTLTFDVKVLEVA